jgi:hypothetical protein
MISFLLLTVFKILLDIWWYLYMVLEALNGFQTNCCIESCKLKI